MPEPVPAERVRTADGVDLAVYDFGGDGPDLLLAHATGFHAHMWLPVVVALRANFHCYAFDERAHGDSTVPPNDDYDWRSFGADALAVVDHLGLDRPYGVGHSCGGALLLLAELARPATFRSLYCFEPVVLPVDGPAQAEPEPDNYRAGVARKRREVFESKAAARANFASKPPMSSFTPEALALYVEHGFEDLPDGTVRLKCRAESEARTYEHGNRHGAYSRLGEIQCPVALVSGEHTRAFGDEIMQLLGARLPQATVEVLGGATHFGPFEAPDEVAAGIRRAFLGEA